MHNGEPCAFKVVARRNERTGEIKLFDAKAADYLGLKGLL